MAMEMAIAMVNTKRLRLGGEKKTHVDGVGPDVKRSEDGDEETPQGPFLETPGRDGGRGGNGRVFARPGLVRCGHGG